MGEENFYNKLSEEEKIVFNKYKSNENLFCYSLNDNLRNNTPNEEQLVDIQILDQIILQHTSENDIVLHRATVEELVIPFLNDNIYHNLEYLSTGTDLDSIEGHFTNPNNPVYMQISCNAGTNMGLLQSNPDFENFENEMLLGRNMNFELIENRTTENRKEIESIMGKLYATGVRSLRIITVKTVN